MKLSRIMTAVILLGAALTPHSAWAVSASLKCPGRYQLDHFDTKTCPANAHRPAIVVKRACCKSPEGRTRCRHMPHCPRRSPSS
jgi:hypothetical protein